MSKVLVTGATGNVGSKLIPLLANNLSLEVVPCYRAGAAKTEFEAMGLSPRFLDMNDIESVGTALSDIDTLFVLKPYTIKMLIQAKVLLDAAKACGVKHIVHLGAHGNDNTPHAIIGWHHMVERYIEALEFDWTHLRPNFFMDNLIRTANPETREVYHYMGDTEVSWVSCQDIAATAAAAIGDPASHKKKAYSLATERASMPQIAKMLSDISGQTYHYVCLPRETGLQSMQKLGREVEFIEPWLDYMDAIKAGEVAEINEVFDPVSENGSENSTSLGDYITEFVTPPRV